MATTKQKVERQIKYTQEYSWSQHAMQNTFISELDQLIGMASRSCALCKALFGTKETRRRKKKTKRRGFRHAPGATGRGGCGEVLCPSGVLPLWSGTDCVSDSLHSSVAACAAALPPSTSCPEVFGPLLGAERTHSYHLLDGTLERQGPR